MSEKPRGRFAPEAFGGAPSTAPRLTALSRNAAHYRVRIRLLLLVHARHLGLTPDRWPYER